MKKLLCPLCGEMPEYIEFGCGDGESDLIQCNCGLCTSAGSYPNGEENCWKDWEKLVSKFPPIMRVWPGDKLVYSSSIYPVTIVSKDLDLCKITVRDYAGDASIIYCDEVDQWPWEIEQKGGQQ